MLATVALFKKRLSPYEAAVSCVYFMAGTLQDMLGKVDGDETWRSALEQAGDETFFLEVLGFCFVATDVGVVERFQGAAPMETVRVHIANEICNIWAEMHPGLADHLDECLVTYLEAAANPPSEDIEPHMSVAMRFCQRLGRRNLSLAAKAMARFVLLSKGVHEVLNQYKISARN
jgi:hypothetical protein